MISVREITPNGYILFAVDCFCSVMGQTITPAVPALYGVGFLLTGFATSILGITNGFADMSVRTLAGKGSRNRYIAGLPILCYYAYGLFKLAKKIALIFISIYYKKT
jgi:hypothetical protein